MNYSKSNYKIAQSYAQDNGLFFIETSAKTGSNVQELFMKIGNIF